MACTEWKKAVQYHSVKNSPRLTGMQVDMANTINPRLQIYQQILNYWPEGHVLDALNNVHWTNITLKI